MPPEPHTPCSEKES